MTTLHEFSTGWHPGEQAVHTLLRVPTSQQENPTSTGLPAQYAYRVARSPLVAFGTLDEHARPWTTIWGGERAFARPLAQNFLGVRNLIDRRHDPVAQALLGSAADGEIVRPMTDGVDGKITSALSIDLETRDRVKLAGRVVVASVESKDASNPAVGVVQLGMLVQESLGNCPKYLNKKDVTPHVPSPELVSDTLPLPKEALVLIDKADMFFLSSTNGQTMDTNHRGGPRGFVRVLSNSKDGVVLVYPEYSGNRLYQTLGNLHTKPTVGVAIPDFDSSDVLFLTGETELLVGQSATALLSHTKLAVKITIKEARYVRDGLPFRGKAGEPSPYNPPVRPLLGELESGTLAGDQKPTALATLVGREAISPTVARYVFKLKPSRGTQLRAWKPGQHVTFDFSGELDFGWQHMCDDDPQSLNDDFVRTFTISNPPPASPHEGSTHAVLLDETQLEITARRHGPATSLLYRHNIRVPLELPVLGFGGESAFQIPLASDGTVVEGQAGKLAVFVAGGVGITPLLAQAPGVLSAAGKGKGPALRVLWSLRAADMPLALHVLEKFEGLGPCVKLFVTGNIGDQEKDLVARLEGLGAQVIARRMEKADVLGVAGDGLVSSKKYYLCTNAAMLKVLLVWLEGQQISFESFNY